MKVIELEDSLWEPDSVCCNKQWGKYGLDKLRVVTELANVGLQQEAILATIMPEEPGSVGVHRASELEEMQERLESSRLKTFNLTKSDLVKDHLRYLGETGANVLAGIQVARDKIDEFQARANSLGYDYNSGGDRRRGFQSFNALGLSHCYEGEACASRSHFNEPRRETMSYMFDSL